MGQSPRGLFGSWHMPGTHLGRQAQYLRVPGADVGQGTVERDVFGADEHALSVPALGVREATAAVTLLSRHRVRPTLASRVADDAMHLSPLAVAADRSAGQICGHFRPAPCPSPGRRRRLRG